MLRDRHGRSAQGDGAVRPRHGLSARKRGTRRRRGGAAGAGRVGARPAAVDRHGNPAVPGEAGRERRRAACRGAAQAATGGPGVGDADLGVAMVRSKFMRVLHNPMSKRHWIPGGRQA
ncbi:hypothetical protein CBM2586_A10740 [Cupriavidus phytorum]|uniref:Uncharacterized protein n=1 Tax=Cupriavidus taiwanensis TaxID=164546 RepID=A0A975ZW11_9BURK|nr:hypothetical protein CBM2586_A10740 [Cupriavidus taiwanensis]